MNRDLLRQKAKKVYKEAAKKVPKKQRKTFAIFYKEFIKAQFKDEDKNKDDVDLEDIINVNEITDEEEQD